MNVVITAFAVIGVICSAVTAATFIAIAWIELIEARRAHDRPPADVFPLAAVLPLSHKEAGAPLSTAPGLTARRTRDAAHHH